MANISGEDQKFISQARPIGLAEIKMGQMARDYATRPELQQFADKLIQDHTDTNKRLMEIARKKNLSVPGEPDAEHQKLVDELWNLEGEEFDKRFVEVQLQDHQKVVSLYEHEASAGQDPEIKEFAKGCVPVLKQHLDTIQSMSKTLH